MLRNSFSFPQGVRKHFTGSADIFWFPQGERRGHRPVLDTCANEAIPRWGKGGLINHLYLQAWPAQSTLKRCCFYRWPNSEQEFTIRLCRV